MAKGNYGIDSPAIVLTLGALGAVVLSFGLIAHSSWRWAGILVGGYFLLGAAGMLFYSKAGKLALRERLLDQVAWRGDEKVLDAGCGRGLLAVGAARRISSGSVIAMDVWKQGAVSGNRKESVLDNAKFEGVDGKVETKQGDVRQLPFADESFDVIVSNFVVHELQVRGEREQMMREFARVLKPGGQVALADFIFTDECVDDLRKFGLTAERQRDGKSSFWITAVLNFGLVRTYHVFGRKELEPRKATQSARSVATAF